MLCWCKFSLNAAHAHTYYFCPRTRHNSTLHHKAWHRPTVRAAGGGDALHLLYQLFTIALDAISLSMTWLRSSCTWQAATSRLRCGQWLMWLRRCTAGSVAALSRCCSLRCRRSSRQQPNRAPAVHWLPRVMTGATCMHLRSSKPFLAGCRNVFESGA